MGDNKISEAIRKLAYETGMWYSQNEKCQPGVPFYAFTQGELDRFVEKLSNLQGEAVPVAWQVEIPGKPFSIKIVRREDVAWEHAQSMHASYGEAPDIIPLYTHRQPAELNEVSGNSGELPPMPPMGYEDRRTGMGQHDVYYTPAAYTAEQMQDYARAALAATGKQQVGEVQGSREQFEAWAARNGFDLQSDFASGMTYWYSETRRAWDVWQAAIASRQPVGQERVAWASTGATGHKVVAMPGLHKLPYGDYDLYAAPLAQGLSTIATRKLEELAAQGYVTNGVAIFNPETGRRGLVDNLGYVGWQGANGVDSEQLIRLRNDLHTMSKHGVKDGWEDAAIELVADVTKLLDGRDAGTGVGRG